jgi:4-hydroxythreonine-4-phosphate dehydrogenase
MTLPRIGVSLGDPGGIGPEVILKSFSRTGALAPGQYILFGAALVLEGEARELGLRPFWESAEDGIRSADFGVWLRELGGGPSASRRGRPSAENGRDSFRYFEEAVAAARRGELQAVVTGPVSKTSWDLAGIPFRGHTEYLERFYPDAVMTFWSERLTMALLSHHLPLADAMRRVTRANLSRLFRLLRETLDRGRPGACEFLVAGLNPHAGEEGLLGAEERTEIGPAIEEARRRGMRIRGPLPPDTVFREALDRPERVVVALYHDQGLIPFKLTSFETGVNVTLGLPFVRTSPDHGTAFDIAGKNVADARSMSEALRLAAALAAGVL